MFGFFKKEYTIEAYGKLPFYKDYINLITSLEATAWQEWLLKVFGQKKIFIPTGIWHFLFSTRKETSLVTGIITQSSDGRRNFPFSLFVNLGNNKIKNDFKWAELFVIKDRLVEIYNTLNTVSDINECYNTLSGMTVVTRRKTTRSRYLRAVNNPNLKFLSTGNPDNFPNFSIVSKNGVNCLSEGSFEGNEIISKWNASLFEPVDPVSD